MSQNSYTSPSQDTHFLVSGGGKGITAKNVIALAREFQSEFTLLGRSQLMDEEPIWAQGIDSESELKQNLLKHFQAEGKKLTPKELNRMVQHVLSSREIQGTIQQVKRAGSAVRYLQADITNSEELENLLKPISSTINGLLHGAGALADKYIQDKEESDFELVYGVKVDGLKNILQTIPVEDLDYLILFSSVAGFYGNAGQADYSLGNEILNKLAHHLKRKNPACQILAIDWGPWDGGMVTPQLKRILTRKNIQVIPIEEGTNTLVNLLSQPIDTPQWIVGNPMPVPATKVSDELQTFRIIRQLSIKDNPYLADHVIGGNAVLPTVCAVHWFVNSCEKLYPGFSFYSLKDYQVYKGIVFDEVLTGEYLLELEEIQKSSDSLVFQGKISSEPPEGKIRYHYQAQIELKRTIPPQPTITGFNLSKDSSISGKELYESKVLFHGSSFQGVQEVLNISPTGLTLRCLLPSIPSHKTGQFPVKSFNPYLADVHLQSILIWAWNQLESSGLPLRIADSIQYQTAPFDTETYATMQVVTSSKHKLVANVISHDQEGNVFTKVSGAEITLNTKLLDLFQQNQLNKEILWQ